MGRSWGRTLRVGGDLLGIRGSVPEHPYPLRPTTPRDAAIEDCPMAAVGGHLQACDHCGAEGPVTIPAATATARSARHWRRSAGSRPVAQSSCRCPTSIWSSPCPMRSTRSPWETQRAFCFKRPRRPYSASVGIPSGSGAMVSRWCSTPGASISVSICVCTCGQRRCARPRWTVDPRQARPPDRSTPPSPSGHRPTLSGMRGLNTSPPRSGDPFGPPPAMLRPRPPH
jgi:hypothetical protein